MSRSQFVKNTLQVIQSQESPHLSEKLAETDSQIINETDYEKRDTNSSNFGRRGSIISYDSIVGSGSTTPAPIEASKERAMRARSWELGMETLLKVRARNLPTPVSKIV
jgi:hypothetical protein